MIENRTRLTVLHKRNTATREIAEIHIAMDMWCVDENNQQEHDKYCDACLEDAMQLCSVLTQHLPEETLSKLRQFLNGK